MSDIFGYVIAVIIGSVMLGIGIGAGIEERTILRDCETLGAVVIRDRAFTCEARNE